MVAVIIVVAVPLVIAVIVKEAADAWAEPDTGGVFGVGPVGPGGPVRPVGPSGPAPICVIVAHVEENADVVVGGYAVIVPEPKTDVTKYTIVAILGV